MKKDSSWLHCFLKIFLFVLFSTTCFADNNKVRLSLISESKTVGNNPTLLLGLRAQIAQGWKTYWRTPGVAGYGIGLNWEGSRNIKSAHLLWPFPSRTHTQLGAVNAYEGDVVFPLKVEVVDPTKAVHVSMQVDMLICDEANCLPVMQTLTLDLPKGFGATDLESTMLRQALSKVPQHKVDRQQNSLQIQSVEVVNADEAPPTIHVILSRNEGVFKASSLPEIFLEIKDMVVDAPLVTLSKDQKFVHYTAPVYPNVNRVPTQLPNLVGTLMTLSVEYQNERFEIDQILQKQPFNFGLLWIMLLTAFIGGLILNIMPCVLPVLSLKVLSIIRHGGGHNTTVRQEFLATVLGILFSFIVLASCAILLKISGHAVGWGIQFQDPYFLISLIGILTLFGCNLFGFFEFRLPSFLSLGGISPRRQSLIGSFFEGSLATALATPCTAPFLGTALAFALSQGIFEIISIFMAMGLGLAFPFLLIAFFPKLATKLPKPGSWIISVKYGLGSLIILAAFWLVYVLASEIGHIGAYVIVVLMFVLAALLMQVQNGSESRKRKVWLGTSLLLAASFLLPIFLPTSPPQQETFKTNDVWRKFEPDRIASYVRAGKTVVVNVTADWCLTCQANKYFVLKSKAVLEALQDPNIIAMEADWTNHDPKIAAYLKSFNQYGIPFYAVYGCKTPRGKFLGSILTSQKILDAFQDEKCSTP